MRWIALAVGGLAGTFSRYALGSLVYRFVDARFPYGTIAVNILGCFLIGVLDVLANKKFVLDGPGRMLLMAGFCGAFTTFSSFMMETGQLVRNGQTLAAFANVLVSVALGFGAYRLGIFVGEM